MNKITIEHGESGDRASVKFKDESIEEFIRSFFKCLAGSGFNLESVKEELQAWEDAEPEILLALQKVKPSPEDVPPQYKPKTDEFVLAMFDLVHGFLPVLEEIGDSISMTNDGYKITVEKEG